jgi:type IV pilus assembly protein PilM
MLLEAAAAEVSLNGQQQEVVQAVSVAAAYYEDMLHRSPTVVLSAGSTGAEALGAMLHDAGFGVVSDTIAGADAVRVRELVTTEALGPQATTTLVPASWLAGVRGALRS